LNQFGESLKRSAKRKDLPFQKIPLFCTLDTYERLRDKGGQSYVLKHHLAFREILPEQPFAVGTDPVVRFTPIPVAHGGVKQSVIFVAEIGSKKVVFAWDIDVPPKGLPSGGITNEEVMTRNASRFEGTDILFIAANTWNADETKAGGEKATGHSSYLRAKSYFQSINAKKVFLVHLSGHEDGEGNYGHGYTDSDWDSAVTGDNGGTVEIARQGMVVKV
jgi:hypothetical protein